MGDVTQDFFRAVNNQAWKDAYDLCNCMDMFGMLRALTSLETRFLTELRAQMPNAKRWGANMPRIEFAMDVVQNRKVPSLAPPGLPLDQVDAANTFLRLTVNKEVIHNGGEVIEEWAARFERGDKSVNNRFLCPDAIPYLALTPKGAKHVSLTDQCYGYKLGIVHGLSVHCMVGSLAPNAYAAAQNKCVNTWNNNAARQGKQKVIASAHFAIASDGTLAQFIPTNYAAFGQGSPPDYQWISVEVDNDGTLPMLLPQLMSAKRLFSWVCRTFAVPHTLATGYLCKDSPWDAITRAVCSAAGVSVSGSQTDAQNSRGLSCHRWIDPSCAFGGGHSCPGKGILGQLATIANPGPVSI